MKIKTSELIDEKLDWAVSYALGHNPLKDFHSHGMTWRGWWETAAYIDTKPNEYRRIPRYSINWAQGGPIIEREKIDVFTSYEGSYIEGADAGSTGWASRRNTKGGPINPKRYLGPTPLIAAMRCYVTSELGDEVEIPEELL